MFEIEASHPELVATMLTDAAKVWPRGPTGEPKYSIQEDGNVKRTGDGTIFWPSRTDDQLTENFSVNTYCPPSAAGVVISTSHGFMLMQRAFTAELPRVIMDIAAADPTDPVSVGYRRYIKTVWNPSVQRVAKILQAHSSVMENPPMSWLKEVYPLISWHLMPTDTFQHMWIAYAKGIESLLASWEEGDFKGCAITSPASVFRALVDHRVNPCPALQPLALRSWLECSG